LIAESASKSAGPFRHILVAKFAVSLYFSYIESIFAVSTIAT
jgi:hypothetical protein